MYGWFHMQYRAAYEKVQVTYCQYFMLGAHLRYIAPVIQSAGFHTSSTHVAGRVQKYIGNTTVNRALHDMAHRLNEGFCFQNVVGFFDTRLNRILFMPTRKKAWTFIRGHLRNSQIPNSFTYRSVIPLTN
jgi:hypothetical protein